MLKRIAAALAAGLVSIAALAGCTSDADRASENLSTAAEQFEINRRIVFFNGITDKYLLTIEGRCSVETGDSKLEKALEVTCKLGADKYKKHFLGLSDNVSFFVEQLEAKDVSVYHYRVLFKPENLVPDIDIQGGKQ